MDYNLKAKKSIIALEILYSVVLLIVWVMSLFRKVNSLILIGLIVGEFVIMMYSDKITGVCKKKDSLFVTTVISIILLFVFSTIGEFVFKENFAPKSHGLIQGIFFVSIIFLADRFQELFCKISKLIKSKK